MFANLQRDAATPKAQKKAKAAEEDKLPPGWTSEWREAPAKRYRVYRGPDGASSKTNVGAWRVHKGEASAQHDRVGGKRKTPTPSEPARGQLNTVLEMPSWSRS